MLELPRPPLRPAAGHHDRRERAGHPQRQHDLHRRGRPLRAGRPAPAPRPRRALQAPRLLLPADRPEQEPLAQRGQAAAGDRGVQPPGGRLRHRHAGPGNPRGGQYPRRRAERTHRRNRLRAVLRPAGAGRGAAPKSLPPKTSIEVDVDLPGEGYIPRSYVPDMRLKIDLYRRLARVSDASELADIAGGVGGSFRATPSAGAAFAGAGGGSDRRPSLGDYVDSSRGPVRGLPVFVAAADRAIGRPERGAAPRGRCRRAPISRWRKGLRSRRQSSAK